MDAKRTNYILIDHENIRSLEIPEIDGLPVKVLIFVSGHSQKPAWEDVEKMLKHPGQFEPVTMEGGGKNALDFLMACHAGRISAADPKAFIHIISKDKGFDPLIAHLKTLHVFARRSESIDKLPIFQKENAESMTPAERVARTTGHLEKTKARPRRRKTLESSIAGWFGKQLSSEEVAAVVSGLEKAGALVIDDKGVVTYRL